MSETAGDLLIRQASLREVAEMQATMETQACRQRVETLRLMLAVVSGSGEVPDEVLTWRGAVDAAISCMAGDVVELLEDIAGLVAFVGERPDVPDVGAELEVQVLHAGQLAAALEEVATAARLREAVDAASLARER